MVYFINIVNHHHNNKIQLEKILQEFGAESGVFGGKIYFRPVNRDKPLNSFWK